MKKTFTLLFMFCSLICLSLPVHAVADDGPQKGTRELKGVVVDKGGIPVIGASVVVKGTRTGVATGIKGDFTIKIPNDGATLLFSYIGMEPKTVVVTTQTTLKVQLQESANSIDEITVVGAYGMIQKRSEMVGSAYQIDGKKLSTLPSGRIDNILKGLIPGLSIEPNSDVATVRSRYNVRIRGNHSLSAGREPLWIVDGVPIYTGDNTNQVTGTSYSVSPLSFLDPADIESVTVLKDATETSIYGANGSNGIILVTTKRAQTGEPSVNATLKYGVSTIDRSTVYKLLNGSDYLTLAREAWANGGNDMNAFPYLDNDFNAYSKTDVDWYDQFYDLGQSIQANVSISGGTDRMSNRFSANYLRDDPAVKGNSTDRLNVMFNTNYKLSKKLTFDAKAIATYADNTLFSPSRDAQTFLPVMSPYNEDGTYRQIYKKNTVLTLDPGDIDPNTKLPVTEKTNVFWPLQTAFFNSLAERDENTNRQRTFTTTSNASLEYEFIKGLSLRAEVGVNYSSTYEDMYAARTNINGGATFARASASVDPERKLTLVPTGYGTRRQATFTQWINKELLTYKVILGKHSVTALAGFEMRSNQRQSLSAYGNNYPNDKIQEVEYAQEKKGTSNSNIQRTMGYFFQGRYAYDNRYFLTANFRSDGTSDFGEHSKWLNFASVGVSWNVHREKFFDVSFMDQLKVRASYGTTGNSRISSAISYGAYSSSLNNGYNGQLGSQLSGIANPGLSWEKVKKLNLGVDLGFFNRLRFSLEYYNEITNELLSELYIPRVLGQSRAWRNVGELSNKGVEFSFEYDVLAMRDITWSLNGNLSHNRNKIEKLNDDGRMVSFGNTAWVEGQDMDAHMVIRWAGVDPRDGKPLWYDKNGNITRSYSYDNRVPYLTSRPSIEGGFGSTFRWKSLTLNLMFVYGVGGYENSSLDSYGISDGLNILDRNQSVNMLDRWQYPGQLAPNPKNVALISSNSGSYNSRFLYSKTFLNFSNLALTYTVPTQFASRIGMKMASVSFICNNVALWTPKDYANRNSYKTIMNGDPVQRTFMLSLDMSF